MTATMELALALKSPVYLRMGKSDRGDVHTGPPALQAGEMVQVRRGKQRLALLATGSMVKTALELCERGLDAEVWSVPCIKPLSRQQLAEVVARVDGLVTLEEHSVMGGLGACIAEEAAAIRPLPICRIGVQDRFSAYCGTWDYLLKEHQIDLPSVQKRVQDFVNHLSAGLSAATGTP